MSTVRQTGSETLPAPVDLRTRTLSAHSVRLHWLDPSLDHTQRIVDERYYNVYYHASPHGKNLSVIVKALHVTLRDLDPGRRYRFKVRTVKGVNTSPFSVTATHRTPPNNGQYFMPYMGIYRPINNNNNNNNSNNQRQCLWCYPHDNGHCESSPGSFDECRLSAGWPPTLRPSQPTWL